MEVSLRALNSRQSVLQRADGSAQWQQGHTELLAAVYGPREAARKHELMDRADLQIIVHPGKCSYLHIIQYYSQRLTAVLASDWFSRGSPFDSSSAFFSFPFVQSSFLES